MTAPSFVGIDVSAQHLDVAVLPGGTHFTLANTDSGMAKLVDRLGETGTQIVVLEATGGYELAVAYALSAAHLHRCGCLESQGFAPLCQVHR